MKVEAIPTPPIREGVMAKLRAATRHHHQQLDSDPRIAAYFQTQQGVGELLGRWYGFFVPYEARLEATAHDFRNLVSERKKTPLLLDDLRFHGIDPERLPMCDCLPRIEDEIEMLGAMYVTEGSTLGGRFLARDIEKSVGLSNNQGYSFFNSYGDQTGSCWKEFGQIVEEACANNPQRAIASADKTFECVHHWLVQA
jgi:heme oxygenase (biliverdin-IX-beta and delta-forming)